MIPEYWWPYIYQYGVGAVIFLVGLALILGYRSCNLSRRQDRFWFGVLIFGFFWYAGIHLAWYFLAIYVLPTAETGGSGG
jgi:hypothetical protein